MFVTNVMRSWLLKALHYGIEFAFEATPFVVELTRRAVLSLHDVKLAHL